MEFEFSNRPARELKSPQHPENTTTLSKLTANKIPVIFSRRQRHFRAPAVAAGRISAILSAVRLSASFLIFLAAYASLSFAQPHIPSAAASAAPVPLQAPAGPQTTPQPPPVTPAPAPASQPAVAPPSGFVVVLDPAHGGADTGARGESGAIEKDVVLEFARTLRAQLERQGFRVLMTRTDDIDPTYDDRDAVANAHREALFISIHASSTGTVGTARAYYYQFWSPLAPPADEASGSAVPIPPTVSTAGFVPWEQAQRPYQAMSHLFADLVQNQLAQLFSGSPAVSAGVEERELRSITGPAVAVEISSVSVPDPKSLSAFGNPLAVAIAKAVGAWRAPNPSDAKSGAR